MRFRSSCVLLGLVLAGCSSDASKDSGAAAGFGNTGGIATSPGTPTESSRVSRSVPAPRAGAAPSERSVYYDFDNSMIHDADIPLLQKNARYLAAHPAVTVTVEGNCDERGSNEYNVALGERRALAAKKLLESYGVSANQISVVSYGKERPKAACHQEKCWQENRRSDLVYGGSA